MKKSIILSGILILNIITMLFVWFGDRNYVSAILGIVVLKNPITLISIILYLLAVWYNFKKICINKFLCVLSLMGIVGTEIYTMFTWYINTITGKFDFIFAINNIRISAIIGIIVTIMMIPLSIKIKNENCKS